MADTERPFSLWSFARRCVEEGFAIAATRPVPERYEEHSARVGAKARDIEEEYRAQFGDRMPDTQVTALLALRARIARGEEDAERWRAATTPRPVEDLHEDDGVVLLWTLPIQEPPCVGSSLDDDFPGHRTHFTPLNELANAIAKRSADFPQEVATVAREDEFDWCGTGHHENCNVHDEDIARSRHYAQKPCNCHDWRERNAADFPQMNGEKP